MKEFLICFVPLFVALDPLGTMPVYLSMTTHFPKKDRDRILAQSILTALIISLVFLFAGTRLFKFLGIEMADFQIAGGVLLLIIAILDLVHPSKEQRQPNKSIGVVPIGIPLIMGPAALTTLMMLNAHHTFSRVGAALLVNLAFMATCLLLAGQAKKLVGINGMMAFSKIISLFMAAIAVMFIRVGLKTLLG